MNLKRNIFALKKADRGELFAIDSNLLLTGFTFVISGSVDIIRNVPPQKMFAFDHDSFCSAFHLFSFLLILCLLSSVLT